jgi:hypothetical protein
VSEPEKPCPKCGADPAKHCICPSAPSAERLKQAWTILDHSHFGNHACDDCTRVALALEEAARNCGHDPCQKGIWDSGWMTGLREGREEFDARLRAAESALAEMTKERDTIQGNAALALKLSENALEAARQEREKLAAWLHDQVATETAGLTPEEPVWREAQRRGAIAALNAVIDYMRMSAALRLSPGAPPSEEPKG